MDLKELILVVCDKLMVSSNKTSNMKLIAYAFAMCWAYKRCYNKGMESYLFSELCWLGWFLELVLYYFVSLVLDSISLNCYTVTRDNHISYINVTPKTSAEV